MGCRRWGARETRKGEGQGEVRESATRNSAFLPRRLIAMGHAYEELIIKIKYCRERVARVFPLLSDDEGVGWDEAGCDATPTVVAAAAAAAVVLWFSAPQAVIYIIKHTWLICWKMLRLTPTSVPRAARPRPLSFLRARSPPLIRRPRCHRPKPGRVTHCAWFPADTGVSCVCGFPNYSPFPFYFFLFYSSYLPENFGHLHFLVPLFFSSKSSDIYIHVCIYYMYIFSLMSHQQ